MADDPWANWKPTANPTARGNEAYQARRALSRGLSVDPMSPGSASQTRSQPARQPPASSSNFGPVASSSSQSARRPLPEQSFPGSGRGGPSRSGGGWQRSPPAGHLDRGWANKTGHEEPIAKPAIVGDIESASNAPLTQTQKHDMQNSSRPGRDEIQDRTRRRLDEEKRNLDSSNASSRDSKRNRSRDRSRDRERDKDRDRDRYSERERDRKRARTDDDREDRRRTTRERNRSRSRSPERRRDHDRRDRRREDERRDRRREEVDSRRDRRSPSPRSDRHSDDGRSAPQSRRGASPDRRTDQTEKKKEPQPARDSQVSPKDNLIPEEASHATTKSEYAGNEAAEHVIVIKGVREGTTAIDMRTILEDFGQVTYCKEVQASDIPAGTLAFEAGFKAVEGAKKAVKELDGIMADGCKLKASLLTSSVKQEEQDTPEPQPEAKGLKLKGFASANNQDNSLLSRLGAPIKQSNAAVNGKDKPNGRLPEALLRPYDDLLRRAGVESLSRLKQLIRPGTVKEYVELLCKEFPDEDLLRGLTAQWALKERLEEWLGEKEPLKLDWEGHQQS